MCIVNKGIHLHLPELKGQLEGEPQACSQQIGFRPGQFLFPLHRMPKTSFQSIGGEGNLILDRSDKQLWRKHDKLTQRTGPPTFQHVVKVEEFLLIVKLVVFFLLLIIS